MADPDIRRMGKKHKKHKKEYSQYHNIRLPGKPVASVKSTLSFLALKEYVAMMCVNWNNVAGFLPERVPMPEEPVNEMKVVLKLPRPMENHNGKLRFTPPISSQRHHGHNVHSRPSWGSSQAIPPRELIVSIPFTALCQQEEEEEPIEPETEPMAAAIEDRHSSHHKHKKHKKHKKHRHHHGHHDSAPQEEVRGRFDEAEMGPGMEYPDVTKHESSSLHVAQHAVSTPIRGATKTVAPLRIQVPKLSPPPADISRTSSKHKTHSRSHSHEGEDGDILVSERHGRPAQLFQSGTLTPGAIPSGKHMHTTTTTTTTHKRHHHKHKEKRHHHKSSGYQGDEHVTGYHGNEDVMHVGGGDDDDDDEDVNEQGQAVVMRVTPPTRPLGGKPTAFKKAAEERKTLTSDEYSPLGGTSEKLQTSSHEGHKRHKKKKKKHRKHSKHSVSHSEPEISPTIIRLSGMESEDSQQGHFATVSPLSMGGKGTTTVQPHAHPVAVPPQDMPAEPPPTRSPMKESKRLIQQEASGTTGHSSFQETRRLSQDSGSGSSSSNRLPLRRLSHDKRTPKLEAQSPDVQPPPLKRSRMDDEKPPPSLKFDISQIKRLDIEPRDTPSPVTAGGTQFQPSLRHQTSLGSSDSVASTPSAVTKPSLGEARRSSIGAAAGGEKAQQSSSVAMAPSPPVLQNQAEMKTPQGIYIGLRL